MSRPTVVQRGGSPLRPTNAFSIRVGRRMCPGESCEMEADMTYRRMAGLCSGLGAGGGNDPHGVGRGPNGHRAAAADAGDEPAYWLYSATSAASPQLFAAGRGTSGADAAIAAASDLFHPAAGGAHDQVIMTMGWSEEVPWAEIADPHLRPRHPPLRSALAYRRIRQRSQSGKQSHFAVQEAATR